MKILICGLGAIGSNLANNLVADLKGLHEITLLDRDTLEERNVTAGTQWYQPEQVGMLKTEALQYNIYKWLRRDTEILSMPIEEWQIRLPTFDLFIDCFDNYEARNLLQRYHGVIVPTPAMLHIGFSDQFTFAIEWAENYNTPGDITSGIDICEMEGAASFVKKVAAYGSLVAQEFINHQRKIEMVGNRLKMNLIT